MTDTCKGKTCPMLKKPCIEHACAFYQQLFGQHPQTGAPLAEFDCAFRWQNILLIENSDQQRQTVASIQSFRNEASARTMEGVGRVLGHINETRKLEVKP